MSLRNWILKGFGFALLVQRDLRPCLRRRGPRNGPGPGDECHGSAFGRPAADHRSPTPQQVTTPRLSLLSRRRRPSSRPMI